MRILLTSGAFYAPPRGGSTRSNLAWLRHLSAAGHVCHVVCSGDVSDTVESDGISTRRVPDLTLRGGVLGEEIRSFGPDWVLVSSEDVSQILLREAERAAPGRIVYLAHTPQFFPFGPESWNRDEAATRIVQRAAGVVAIGRHMAGYIEQHAGVKAEVIHPPIYEGADDRPQKTMACPTGLVLMINPCAVKGIEIFLKLAERFPEFPFGALPGWGTTADDLAALRRLPNVRILRNEPNIDDVLKQARLLLMPSIWYEGFGLIVMEAMLRGLPVISSDSGGLMEAKEGTGFVIPVKPIDRYEMVFDENHMPKPVSSPQDIAPWETALRTLLTDESVFQNEATRSREAGLRFVSGVRAGDLERYLLSRPELAPRELLLQRLRKRSSN